MINLLKKTLEDLYNQREEIQIKMEDCEKCIEALEPPVIQEIEAIECTYKKEPNDLFSNAIKKLLEGSVIYEGVRDVAGGTYAGQMKQPDLWADYREMKERPSNLGYEEFKLCIRHIEKKGFVDVHLGSRNTNVVSLIR